MLFLVALFSSGLGLSVSAQSSPAWPDGASEYRFGLSRAAVARVCTESAGVYDRVRERCSRAPESLALGGVSSRVDFAFCRGRLCYVAVDTRYAEVGQAREVYSRLRGGIETEFGSVAGRVQDQSLISPRCQRSDADLRECLRSQQAVIGQRWEFMDDPTTSSPSVEIDLRVVESIEADALTLTLRYATSAGIEARAVLDDRLAASAEAPPASTRTSSSPH